jgi:hypothetical protein
MQGTPQAHLVRRLSDAFAEENLTDVFRHLGALVALCFALDGLTGLAKVKAAWVVGVLGVG